MNKIKLSLAALLVGTSMVAAEGISIYGYLQLNAVYEDGANEAQGDHYSRFAPKNADKADGHFWMNPNSTRLGFDFKGPSNEGGTEMSGKLETDFNNGNPNRQNNGAFRIRHAYGKMEFKDLGLAILMGQSSDLIAPIGAPTINQAGLEMAGSLGTRRPQVRITETISGGLVEIAVAMTNDRTRADVNAVAPAWQGSIGTKIPASWAGEKENIQFVLSGHYALNETSGNNEKEVELKKDKSYPTSWSGVASLAFPVISMLKISGEMFYGQELNRYNGGSIGQTNVNSYNDGAADPTKANIAWKKDGGGIQSIGGWGALELKFGPVALAGGLGKEILDEDRSKGATRSSNTVIFGNLKCNVAKTAWVGFEYANIATDYVKADGSKDDDGKLNRFELALNYAFK